MMQKKSSYIRWFDEISIEDVPIVGGKNASLGEMYRELTPKGVKVPNGFAITADAYWHVLNSSECTEKLTELMKGLDKQNVGVSYTVDRKERTPEDLAETLIFPEEASRQEN